MSSVPFFERLGHEITDLFFDRRIYGDDGSSSRVEYNSVYVESTDDEDDYPDERDYYPDGHDDYSDNDEGLDDGAFDIYFF